MSRADGLQSCNDNAALAAAWALRVRNYMRPEYNLLCGDIVHLETLVEKEELEIEQLSKNVEGERERLERRIAALAPARRRPSSPPLAADSKSQGILSNVLEELKKVVPRSSSSKRSGKRGVRMTRPAANEREDKEFADVVSSVERAERRSRRSNSPTPVQSLTCRLMLRAVRQLGDRKEAPWFRKPVTEIIAPGYFDVIEKPMDLSTLKDNIENGVVTTIEGFGEALDLIVANAKTYNKEGDDVYRAAVAFDQCAAEVKGLLEKQLLSDREPQRELNRTQEGHNTTNANFEQDGANQQTAEGVFIPFAPGPDRQRALGRLGGSVGGNIGQNKFYVGITTDGRPKCQLKSCSNRNLRIGDVRLGKRPPSLRHGHNRKIKWYHPECAMVAFENCTSKSRVLERVEDIDHGFETLSENDQARIRRVIEDAARSRTIRSTISRLESGAPPQRQLPRAQDLNDTFEAAPDGRRQKATEAQSKKRDAIKAKGRVTAPSRGRRNHQAMSKPPRDADGKYLCAHKCGRVFGHAPAAVAHSKTCKLKPDGWQPTLNGEAFRLGVERGVDAAVGEAYGRSPPTWHIAILPTDEDDEMGEAAARPADAALLDEDLLNLDLSSPAP